jgi:uncharacterized phage protein (TIGR01671 family)
MKEILFRGKRIDNGEWAYGYYAFQRKPTGIRGQQVSEHDYDRHLISSARFGSYWDIDPETVGQYIGKMDKNGKRMFEGDKLKVLSFIHPLVIVFGEDELAFEMKCLETGIIYSLNYTGKEVIGNIHDSETT